MVLKIRKLYRLLFRQFHCNQWANIHHPQHITLTLNCKSIRIWLRWPIISKGILYSLLVFAPFNFLVLSLISLNNFCIDSISIDIYWVKKFRWMPFAIEKKKAICRKGKILLLFLVLNVLSFGYTFYQKCCKTRTGCLLADPISPLLFFGSFV